MNLRDVLAAYSFASHSVAINLEDSQVHHLHRQRASLA